MLKFKKDYSLKIISLVVIVTVFVTSTAYGINLSNKTYLRLPMNTEQTMTRLGCGISIMSSIIQVRTIFSRLIKKAGDISKPATGHGNLYYMRWGSWWLNPLVASTLGLILLGLVWAFFLPDSSPFIAQWLSVGLMSWILNVTQGRKALLNPATILLSVGTGVLGPLLGIPDLSDPVLIPLVGLAIISTGFRVYVNLRNANYIERNLEKNVLTLKKKRFNRMILTLTIVSVLLVFSVRHIYNKYDYFSLPQKLEKLDPYHSPSLEASSETAPDYSHEFTWFKYIKTIESEESNIPYFVFSCTYSSPEKFGNTLLYLKSLKAAETHIIPLNAINYIREIRSIPPEYVKWITEIAARHRRSPELFVDAMMSTTWHDYSIGHGVDVFYRRKFDATHITFEGLRRHWPRWWFEFTPGQKITDFITGPLLGARSSIGIYQIRPAMVKRYLKTLDGKDVTFMDDREISIALLNPRTNIEAFAEIQEKVIAQVDSIREDALHGIAPDMTDFYRESHSETVNKGGSRPLVENYSSIPSRAILGDQDWILWIYHPLYYLKFWPRPKNMGLVVLSGIFDDKPAAFDTSEILPEQLVELAKDSDSYIREAAINTIAMILLGDSIDAKAKIIAAFNSKSVYLSSVDVENVMKKIIENRAAQILEKKVTVTGDSTGATLDKNIITRQRQRSQSAISTQKLRKCL